MSYIMHLNTGKLDFDKNRNMLILRNYMDAFPDEVKVVSDHTGKVVRFIADYEEAERNEFWDGEMYQYKSVDDRHPDIVLIFVRG
jgi:type I site-specific restriction-modification system R (restriction) subunit